jgi:hypothetical protein
MALSTSSAVDMVLFSSFTLIRWPNARCQPPLEAEATQERTL